MSSLSQTKVRIVECDFPFGGILAPGWLTLSPDDPSHWHAFNVKSENEVLLKCFLGAGDTTLSQHFEFQEGLQIQALSGFIYLVSGKASFMVLPSKCRGYSSVIATDDIVVFSNYSELLAIKRNGSVHYRDDVAIDDLSVRSVEGTLIHVQGMLQYGDQQARKTIELSSMPQVEFNQFGQTDAVDMIMTCYAPKRAT